MGAPRHPPETKARVLGALWASAEEVDGEWRPALTRVANETGVRVQTVFRWWTERDPSGDGKARDAVTRAREELRQTSVKAWLMEECALIQARMREVTRDPERWVDCPPDAVARAGKDFALAAASLGDLLGLEAPDDPNPGPGDDAGDPVEVTVRIRSALGRARNGGRPTGGAAGEVPD